MRRTLVFGLSLALAAGWAATPNRADDTPTPAQSVPTEAAAAAVSDAAGKVGQSLKSPKATGPATALVKATPPAKDASASEGPSLFDEPLLAVDDAPPAPTDEPAESATPTPAAGPPLGDAPSQEPTLAAPPTVKKPEPKTQPKTAAKPEVLEEQLESTPIDGAMSEPTPAKRPTPKVATRPAPKPAGVQVQSSRRAPGANETPRTIGRAEEATPIYNESDAPTEAAPSEAGANEPTLAPQKVVESKGKPTLAAEQQEPTKADEPTVAKAAERAPVEISPQMFALHDQIEAVLTSYKQRHLNTRDHNHWEVMHQIVAWGCDTEIELGGPGGRPVNAISYQLFNNRCMGDTLMYVDRVGVQVRKGYKVQGHFGQFLGMLAQSRVPTNYPVRVDGKDFTLADIIETEKATCVSRTELTFKLLSLSYYVKDTDETWTSSIGEKWNLQRLIREEIAAPIAHDAACGGTHRLMGMAYAVHRRKLEGKPLTGEFGRAKTYLNDFHKYTLKLQNSDGSFSTDWFRGRGNSQDIDRRLQTTGHILEWLVFSLPQDELQREEVVSAVKYLTSIMAANPDRRWEIGPMGHALHGLKIYNQRVFSGVDPVQQSAANPAPATDAPSKKF